MPCFEYQAMDATGRVVKEKGSFESLSVLYTHLKEKGYTLIDYRRCLFPKTGRMSFGKIPRPMLSEFFRNLSLLVKGGVPLLDALRDMAESSSDRRFKQIIGEICRRIEDGELLSQAMAAYPNIFGRVPTVLVSIGEETGRLDTTLIDAAKHIERIHEIISNTKRAMTYPLFVVVAMTGALCFWLLYVLPKILVLFKEMGMDTLPLPTRILIIMVDIFHVWWPVLPGSVLGFLLFRFLAGKNSRVKYLYDSLLTRMPLVGAIIRASQMAFLFEYLALLVQAGIDILKSLTLMEESISHQVLKQGVAEMRAEITNGTSLTEAFRRLPMLDPFVTRLISVGELTGELPEQMKTLADFYRQEVNKLVDAIGKSLEPIMIVVAGLLFALIAVGLLGPIYDLMGGLN